ncbi:MAG: response regulator [Rubripirellula sp.]|jgi:chemotaxis family two-component system response regulator Rcp1
MINDLKTKPMEILLVEDGLTDAKMTMFAVRRSQVHHRLTLMRTLNDALRFLERQSIYAQAPRPDLILLDLMLPDGSGLEILDSVNQLENQHRPTVVALTASNDESLRDRCQTMGVHDFMKKPVHEREFMRVIRDHKKLMIHSTPLLSRPTF